MTRLKLSLLLLCILSGCNDGFAPSDTLSYVQDKPVAPVDSYVAPTGSMYPNFIGGERIHIAKIDIEDIKVGDVIVTYWEGARIPVIHRVIKVFTAANGEIGLVTKGDANPERDLNITTKDELVGIATKVK